MASIIANTFSSFSLTEDEELQGSLLTVTQKQVIHNLRAIAAEAKLVIPVDPSNISIFLQKEAEATGYIAALTDLLNASEASELLLSELNNR